MQTNDTATLERAVTDGSTDLQKRDVRALTEYMTVLPLGGGLYSVTTGSGSEYRVDALKGRCTCPDKQHNLEDGDLCKHERRVQFATGEWVIPGWADTEVIDSQLGEHVSGTPQIATTDGELPRFCNAMTTTIRAASDPTTVTAVTGTMGAVFRVGPATATTSRFRTRR